MLKVNIFGLIAGTNLIQKIILTKTKNIYIHIYTHTRIYVLNCL